MKHVLNYFCKLSQDRLKERIKVINNEREILKKKPLYSDLKKKITYTDLYKNKPQIIKNILSEDYTKLKNLLTFTIANSIKENMKLKPELITNNDDDKLCKKLKRENKEFLSVSEIFWGEVSDITDKNSKVYHNLILCICLDFLEVKETRIVIERKLMEYIPYASYIGHEQALIENEGKELSCFLDKDAYRNSNIDVLGEAIYYFSKSEEAMELAKLFNECISTEVQYESKVNGRFYLKNEIVQFNNFNKAVRQYKDKFLEIFQKKSDTCAYLGERVYNILRENSSLQLDLMYDEISIGADSLDRYLTATEESYHDVINSFLNDNEKYIESLKNFQIELHGDIEREYFMKKPFNKYQSEYFSSERWFHLTSEIEEMISYYEQLKLNKMLEQEYL